MRTTVWVEPRTEEGTYSVRYYDPETGKAQRIPCESFAEMQRVKAETKLMLINRRGGKGNPDALPSVVFESYLSAIAETHRKSTIALKRYAIQSLLARIRRMGALDADIIADWKSAMVKKYKTDTVAIRLRELRAFLNWCVKKGHLSDNPMKDISIPVSTFIGRRITVDELLKMYTHCPDVFRPFFVLAVETGARRGELLGVTWKELDLERATWTIPAERCKTNITRTIPLSSNAVTALRSILPASYTGNEVFTGWTSFMVHYYWRRTLKAAEIVGRVRLHDVRHTFASNFKGRASSLKAICGWSTDVMLNKYTHTVVEELREDMDKFGVAFGGELVRSGENNG